MEVRIEKIISYLCQFDDYRSATEIAGYCGISERTLYRLIPHVMTWLAEKGWALKSKTRKGYKIIGDCREIMSMLKDETYNYFSLSRHERHHLIILVLIMKQRETRIGQLATLLCMSDTSINNDLAAIEEILALYHLRLERRKGTGILISGEEFSLRCCFVYAFTALVPPDIFIHYLYPENKTFRFGQKKIDHYFSLLEIHEDWEQLTNSIKSLERKIGYYFSYSGFATLLLFLFIIGQRSGFSALIGETFDTEFHPDYLAYARFIATQINEAGATGAIADKEIASLAVIIAGMEIGTITQPVYDRYFSSREKIFSEILDATLVRIETLTGHFISFEGEVKNAFLASLSALAIRARYHIPIWHESWLEKRQSSPIEHEFSASIIELTRQYLGLEVTTSDVQNLQFTFAAIYEDTQKVNHRKVRTCIVCFEGIGLASYVRSRLLKIFPDLYVVDLLSYHRVDREFIEENSIDLIITTYELPAFDIPVCVIQLPFDELKIYDELHQVIENSKQNSIYTKIQHNAHQQKDDSPDLIPIEIILPLINNFFCIASPDLQDIAAILNTVLDTVELPKKGRQQLFADFMAREDHGSLIFEEWGVRVLHCRSQALDQPIAGVVQLQDSNQQHTPYQCILVMAAPLHAERNMVKGLSSLVTALSDEKEFAHVLAHSPLKTIKKFLFWMYGNYMRFDLT